MLHIPPHGIFPGCWINIANIVSIYYAGTSVYIELPRTTSSIEYEADEDARTAARQFVAVAEGDSDVDTSRPVPISGSIRTNRTNGV